MDCRDNPTIEERTKVLQALCEVAQTYLHAAKYFREHYSTIPRSRYGTSNNPCFGYENNAQVILDRIREIDKHFEGISETR